MQALPGGIVESAEGWELVRRRRRDQQVVNPYISRLRVLFHEFWDFCNPSGAVLVFRIAE
jgi:hypothetical protein